MGFVFKSTYEIYSKVNFSLNLLREDRSSIIYHLPAPSIHTTSATQGFPPIHVKRQGCSESSGGYQVGIFSNVSG